MAWNFLGGKSSVAVQSDLKTPSRVLYLFLPKHPRGKRLQKSEMAADTV